MLIRRPQRPPVRSGRTELGPYASSRSSFPTSRRPSSSAGQVVQVPWSQPAVKLVGGGRQPLTPKGTLVLTRGQQRVPSPLPGRYGQLVTALDGVIPAKQVDRNLLFATWTSAASAV
jgi:hypothetical protein